MGRNWLTLLLIAGLAGGAWYLHDRYDLRKLAENWLQPSQQFGETPPFQHSGLTLPPPPNGAGEIRVGVLDARALNPTQPERWQAVLQAIQPWSLICVTNLHTTHDNLVPNLVRQLTATGKEWDYFLGPRVGAGSDFVQYLFLFDPRRIETDRASNLTLDDALDCVVYDPLVGQFRAKAGPAEQAFTFSVLAWQVHPDHEEAELAAFAPMVRSARQYVRGEDDLIVAATLQKGEEAMRPHYEPLGLFLPMHLDPVYAEAGLIHQYLLFDPLAAGEYTGNSGVVNWARLLNLSFEGAKSELGPLPVWCGFRPFEGNQSGYVPTRGADSHRL